MNQNQTAEQKRKAVVQAFETLIEAERAGAIPNEMKARMIWEAHEYARQNHLPFDGTFRGVMKLAEQAFRMVSDHADIEEKIERREREDRRRRLGFRGTDLVKDLLN